MAFRADTTADLALPHQLNALPRAFFITSGGQLVMYIYLYGESIYLSYSLSIALYNLQTRLNEREMAKSILCFDVLSNPTTPGP